MHKRLISLVLIVLVAVAIATAPVFAQEVLTRTQLGNNVEDISFISSGTHNNSIAILNGYEVYAVSLNPGDESKAGAKRLFDVLDLDLNVAPRGMAYVDSLRLFAFVDQSQRSTLFLSNNDGAEQGTITLAFPVGTTVGYMEGLAYLPFTSTNFPDHLVVANNTSSGTRLEVIRLDGQVVAEIIPDASALVSSYITGVAFLAPDRLVVGTYDQRIWASLWILDFSGHVLSGPLLSPAHNPEGIIQLADGRIVVSDYLDGTLSFFDQDLNRLPEADRLASAGIGMTGVFGLAWNPDTDQYLLAAGAGFIDRRVAVASPALDAARNVLDLTAVGISAPVGLAYISAERLIAVVRRLPVPRAILLYDTNRALVAQIDISYLPSPSAFTYISTTDQFAIASGTTMYVLSRSGNLVRTIDLSAMGLVDPLALAFFDPTHTSGGKFFIAGNYRSGHRAVIADFNGAVLSSFDTRAAFGFLQPVGAAAITSGPQAGALALADVESSSVVVFRPAD